MEAHSAYFISFSSVSFIQGFMHTLYASLFGCQTLVYHSDSLFVLRFKVQSTQWGHVERGQFT